jgi:hypothetical protein
MKIELNVQGSQLDAEVKELLVSLTQEQKQDMAQQILTQSLNNAESSIKISMVREKALADTKDKFKKEFLINEKGQLSNNTYRGPEYDERDYFDKKVREYNDVGTYFKTEILGAMTAHAKSLVETEVKTSEAIITALEQAKAKIAEEMPRLVHDAMVMYFASQMQAMMEGVAKASLQTQHSGDMLQRMQQALSGKGIYL